jgi:L-fuconolactonase
MPESDAEEVDVTGSDVGPDERATSSVPAIRVTVDAHVHVWTRATDPQPWIDPVTMAAIDRDFTVADLVDELDAVGAATAVVVQSINSAAETGRLVASATGRVAGVVGWLDMAGDVPRQLAGFTELLRRRLVGVRHLVHLDPDPAWLERSDVRRGLGALGRAGLPFDLVVRPRQLPLAAATAAALPEVRFVLDHLGNPPFDRDDRAQWEHALYACAALPNTVAKLSGVPTALGRPDWTVATCRDAVAVAIDAFGADRLMYGSDWPVVELVGGMARWHAAVSELLAGASVAEQAAIAGLTASRVYGLST